jgi:hypothetical protein
MKKMWDVFIMEYFSALNNNETTLFAGKLVEEWRSLC